MPMYEFNLWNSQTLKEKIVKEFQNDDEACDFIQKEWKDRGLFTWSRITGHDFNNRPPVKIELSDEDRKLKKKLRDSITFDTIDEWGKNEMSSKIKDDYACHPDATGYTDKK